MWNLLVAAEEGASRSRLVQKCRWSDEAITLLSQIGAAGRERQQIDERAGAFLLEQERVAEGEISWLPWMGKRAAAGWHGRGDEKAPLLFSSSGRNGGGCGKSGTMWIGIRAADKYDGEDDGA